jgi:hypothetical protein
MIVAGFWLAARLTDATAAERLAVASLMGLAGLLWNISVLNFFKPLNPTWAWICLWPVALTLLDRRARVGLIRDLVSVAFNRRGAVAGAMVVVFLLLLLWPLLSRPSLVYYDGTSNHDAFFWISAAEHLKRHSYMTMPVTSALHPLTNATPAIIGWNPAWGRMGAEGLLAFTSSIIGLAPLKLYLAATATLIVPWIAAVFLAVRTFLVGRLSVVATVSLIVLQPVFVFYYGNSNLPNFVGALMAAAVVIATERSLRPEPGRGVWLILLIFGLHGLLCSYPEMLPFVIIPGGLLWLRVWFTRGVREGWKPAAFSAAAWIGAFVVNPASTIRGYWGFVASFDTARANENWANLFHPLHWLEYVPALATLSVGTSDGLGLIFGGLLTIAISIGWGFAIWRATDRVGALFTLAGAGALLAYTLYTGFNYGWQKTVQFGGAFWVAFFPVAIVDALVKFQPARAWVRWLSRACLAGFLALFCYATVQNCLDGHKWSRRKILTQDWFNAREYARDHLVGLPVLIDGATFRMAFFHGMWATYFLPESNLYFAARGHENGGYLRDGVVNEAREPIPQPSAVLVSREWLDTFEANSTTLFTGDTVVLLKTSNRVINWEGLDPVNGVPHNALSQISLTLLPHSASRLSFKLVPRFKGQLAGTTWKVIRYIEGQPNVEWVVEGQAPWNIDVPLEPSVRNRIELTADPLPAPNGLPPFMIQDILIQNRSG